ncbi:MAG TPA: hypothetical protein VGI75_00355 [Pirellulales bacterium]
MLSTILGVSFVTAISNLIPSCGIDPLLVWIAAVAPALLFIAWISVHFVSNDYVAA